MHAQTDIPCQQEQGDHTLSESSSFTLPSQNPEPIQTQPKNQTIIQQNTKHITNRNLTPQPSHKMITISKSEIFKPKLYTTTLANKELDTIQEALCDQNWYQAMRDEFEALIRNKTWSLVSLSTEHKIVENKWVFRVKQNTDGSIAKYKARLVVKGFQQTK